ncbi:ABC transporter ATP-binding protein [Microvirga sp. ACRRW]|nr:ABC transporter ATP-binding protein [Microvirga sp. ACRRW]
MSLRVARPDPAEKARPIIGVDALSISLRNRFGETRSIVNAVDVSVHSGEIRAIVGESGSGKTMLARSLVKLLPPGMEITDGRIEFAGSDLTAANETTMRSIRGRGIGFVFQEPMLSLNPALRIGDQMAEGLRLHLNLSKEEIRERSLAMLHRVRLKDPEAALEAYPHEFSGGMRQRIMLASVLMLEPKLLIADEPTTALDAVIQRDVLDIMVELTRDLGTALLLITHDLGLVGQYANTVSVMRKGEVVEQGHVSDVISRPREEYTRNLLTACPKRRPRSIREQSTPVLEIDKVTLLYAGKKRWPFSASTGVRAVSDVSFDVRPGETVSVVGESGSGKTSLGRVILGLRAATEGQVRFRGKPVDPNDRVSMRQMRRSLQVVFQDPGSSLDPRMRVKDLVAEGLRHVEGLDAKEKLARVLTSVADVGLDENFLNRFPHELSGGQRQRVAIARAIVMRPELIVLDEPVSALDVTIQAQVLDLLDELQRRYGFAYLFVSHDLGVVEQVSDRVVVMYRGRIVEMGSRDQLFDHPQHPYTRRLLAASAEIQQQTDGSFTIRRRSPQEAAPPPGQSFYDGAGSYDLMPATDGHLVAVTRNEA